MLLAVKSCEETTLLADFFYIIHVYTDIQSEMFDSNIMCTLN